MKCPVCGSAIKPNETKCISCNFDKIQTEFLNHKEYANWMFETVLPYRDAYIEELRSVAIDCIQQIKEIDKSGQHNAAERKYLCDKCDEALNKIEDISVLWLIKSVVKIEYTKDESIFDYRHITKYTYDFSKECLRIEYVRDTWEEACRGSYENIDVNSVDLLTKIFVNDKLHKLKHNEDENWYCDGCSWEIKIHLTYPIICMTLDKESYWQYHIRNNLSHNSSTDLFNSFEDRRWDNVDVDFLLEADGQFNEAYYLLEDSIGKYISEPPDNIETIKYDEIGITDAW